jgi:hypothetical protein
MPKPGDLSDLATIPESQWTVPRQRSEAIRPLLEMNKLPFPGVFK